MKVICDTDLLSAFAKIDKLSLLKKAFPKGNFFISNYVYDELLESKKMGFDFPEKIFQLTKITTLNEDEVKEYEKERVKPRYYSLSNSDLASLILARERNLILLSNDYQLLKKAENENVLAIDIYDILRILYKRQKIKKQEVNRSLDKIEKEDNTLFKNRDRIFED